MLVLVNMNIIKKFVSFCMVGGLAFIIDIGFVNLFFFLGLEFPVARTLSISLALIFNFFVNRNVTFKAQHTSAKKQVLPFVVVYIIANLVNLFSSIAIVNLAGANVISINWASFIGTAVSIPFSFLGSLIWTFKKRK